MMESAAASPGRDDGHPVDALRAWAGEPTQDLEQLAREAFVPGGVLARAAEAFLPRAGQTEMAAAVARTIARGGALVVEAGTGVGKTFS